MSFELVDFTTSSPFESLIQTLSYLIERRENKVDIPFHGSLVSICWPGTSAVIQPLTGWKPKSYFTITASLLKKSGSSTAVNISAVLNRQILSACSIALSNLNLLDSISFLVALKKENRSIICNRYEGFALGLPCILEVLDFIPPSLVNLEGLEKLYHSRQILCASKASKEVYARISVSYDIHPVMPARLSKPNEAYDWIRMSASSKIDRLESLMTLVIHSEFPPRHIDYFYALERIDPFLASSAVVLQFDRTVFASLKSMISELSSLYYEFDDNAMIMPLDYIPGGFEGSLGNRVFLDQQHISDGVSFILTEEEDATNSASPVGITMSVQQILDCLRNQELTTSRNSILWKFSKFLMNFKCASLLFNTANYLIFQGLIKGIWSELLKSFQVNRDMENYLPNTLKSYVPIENCLLDQKICMLNYCISRKKAFEQEQGLDPYGRKRKIQNDPPLYEPFTQLNCPMTSDMLQEQQMAFEELAKTEEGKQRLLKVQLTPLISDIAAFKAANPKSTFIDFISWHSPKDLQDGRVLSERFLGLGNIWKRLWDETTPAPICKQKPLFDDERESAKALHYMENMALKDLFLQLKPLFYIIAYENLISQPCKQAFTPLVCSKINLLAEKLSATRNWADDIACEEDILSLFEDCESALLLAEILLDNGLSGGLTDQLIANIGDLSGIVVDDEGDIVSLRLMLIGSRQEFPAPDKKVYALSSSLDFEAGCAEMMSFGVSQNSFAFYHQQQEL